MSAEHAEPDSEPRAFLNKRLMSLLGVVPLSVYVLLHLWTNLSSLNGPEAYNQALLQSRRHPVFIVLELLLGLAILIHTVVGIGLILHWRPSQVSARYFRGLKFLLQRLSGLGVGLFIGAHVIRARILPAMKPPGHETWQGMHEALGEPVTLAVYVLGMLGISYHLANGLWTASITWGLAVTPRTQRRAQWASAVLLVVLMAMSGLSLYGFLQQGPSAEATPAPAAPAPAGTAAPARRSAQQTTPASAARPRSGPA